jgi:hypothetical protein
MPKQVIEILVGLALILSRDTRIDSSILNLRRVRTQFLRP